ncbi:MAG: cysteine desulfurase-like protein [Gammaproteobacteria bacterium]|jgi:cysteine desulfurase family protein (TIGR01976 family)|nr:cysteine desulfurase-like protein [Gammaproteobacteria bacterium]MDH3750393.1 cysteine desulfurase-like protein [Gammaproteobacteria bacterium]MDH3805066.1 cysteine desulfurase-like protein [Gammaproteobacteria bacterium]
MTIDLMTIRAQYPALSETDNGKPRLYFDNPAGTQVPQMVADRILECLLHKNANIGGYFRTSDLAGAVADEARAAMADFLHAPSPNEIIFGQNMTSITFHLSRSIGRHLQAGDEIILSQMEHDANVEPWKLMARDFGLEIRWLPFDTETFEFDLLELDDLLTNKTKLVCVGGASNLTGTINDVETICNKVREAGAWSFIDGVQSAPHVATDVQRFGCDFFVCSAYKFFGPHQGILWGRSDVLEQLHPYKVRPAPSELPWCFEPGTQSHEGMAGTAAAVDYFGWIGNTMTNAAGSDGRRQHICAGLDLLFEYEKLLAARLIEGLQNIPGVTVQGISDPDAMHRRVPTVAFTHDRHEPAAIAEALGQRNIFAWSGHNYALEVAKALGIIDAGGAVRIGAVHYNTVDEIDSVLEAVEAILA